MVGIGDAGGIGDEVCEPIDSEGCEKKGDEGAFDDYIGGVLAGLFGLRTLRLLNLHKSIIIAN